MIERAVKPGEEGLTYEEIGRKRMVERKKGRLRKFTKNREEKKRRGDWCPCCGRSGSGYDY